MATDFQNLVDGFEAPTSVMSVEVLDDGSMGELRVVTGNKGYIDSIEHPAGDYTMRTNKFIPNSIYTDYVPKDLNFEDFCFRSAVQKKCLHSYVNPSQMPVWFNMTFMPIGPSEGNIHYCTYTMEVNFEANTKRMSNITADIASAVLETCIKLRGSNDFHASIKDVVDDIRKMCKAELCSILLIDSYEKTCSTLAHSLSEAPTLRKDKQPTPDEFYKIVITWEQLIGSSNCVIVKNEKDMELIKERTPDWYVSLKEAGISSVVLFPLKIRDTLLGYMWAVNFDAEQAPKIKETLELTTFILASEINNYLLLDRLKILSSKDMLTGVLNRNEMNAKIDTLSGENYINDRTVGIVFADLNGLKTVNDTYGHTAGDALLKDAAKALEEVFPAESIYRAGGDEFTVILTGVTAKELEKKVADLREVSQKYEHVIFAIGYYVEEDFTKAREALKRADEKMYEDKKLFYDTHPDFKKRLS